MANKKSNSKSFCGESKWESIVNEYECQYSGTRLSFCKKNKLNPRAFYYWHDKLLGNSKKEKSQNASFVKVLISNAENIQKKESLTIKFPNGITILLSTNIDNLLHILEACQKCG